MLYAIKIEGEFSYVRTRSVPRQDAYKPLVEVAKEQSEFGFENIAGSMVGFWTPGFLSSVAVQAITCISLLPTSNMAGIYLNVEQSTSKLVCSMCLELS